MDESDQIVGQQGVLAVRGLCHSLAPRCPFTVLHRFNLESRPWPSAHRSARPPGNCTSKFDPCLHELSADRPKNHKIIASFLWGRNRATTVKAASLLERWW